MIQETAGYMKGQDTGKGWIQERAGYRKGLDTGKGWIQERADTERGWIQERDGYRKGLDKGRELDIEAGLDTMEMDWSATVTKLDLGKFCTYGDI